MIEHLTENQVKDYCLQQLSPVDLLSVSDHLGECEACRRQIERGMNGEGAFFALRSEVLGEAAQASSQILRTHPTAEQTFGYVDGNLAGEDHQMVADHLTSCEHCALAIDDLRSFKGQIAHSLEREYQPGTVPSSTEGWWRRTVAAVSTPFVRSPRLAFGMALTILLLAVSGWLMWRMQPQSGPQQQIVELPTPSPQPAPVPVVAQLKDGEGELILDQEGKLSGVDGLPPAYQSMLKEALTSRRIEASPYLKGLSRPPSSLMSADKQKSEFVVIEPVGRVLLSDHPTFSWSPMEGAASYAVEVYDNDFNLVATSPQLTRHSWTPPALARGKVYAWQVKAIKDGQEVTSPRPPAPQARFRVLDQAKANELAKARQAYRSSHLALGLLYAEAGLLREAEQELRLVQKANPDSALARSLFDQVRALGR